MPLNVLEAVVVYNSAVNVVFMQVSALCEIMLLS